MRLQVFHIDAFTDRRFAGNPAAVILLDGWLDESLMQSIAAEINLSETTFVVRDQNDSRRFSIRWFTPKIEVPLCGHATLAAAFVIDDMAEQRNWPITFESASGALKVDHHADSYVLDFPAIFSETSETPDGLPDILGCEIAECLHGNDFCLAVIDSEETLANLKPDFSKMQRAIPYGVIVTAPGRDVDFVSRFFAPALGLDEDPVTGSAHCLLMTYWSKRIGRLALSARQLSQRGGDLHCELVDDRVLLKGTAVAFSSGTIEI